MKKIWLFLLFVFQIQAQNDPLGESNALVYSNYRFGINTDNAFKVFQKKDGSVITGTHFHNFFHFTNTKINILNHYFEHDDFLYDYFEHNDLEIFCTNKAIVIIKNNKRIHRLSTLKGSEGYGMFFLNPTKNELITKIENKLLNKAKLVQLNLQNFSFKKLLDYDDKKIEISYLENGKIYFYKPYHLRFFKLKNQKLIEVANYPELPYANPFLLGSLNSFYWYNENNKSLLKYENGKRVAKILLDNNFKCSDFDYKNTYINYYSKGINTLKKITNNQLFNLAKSSQIDRIVHTTHNLNSNTIYASTQTDFAQLIPHIKQYPKLYYNSNSNNVFTLQQHQNGTIYAGSYSSGLATFNSKGFLKNTIKDVQFMNGSIALQNHLLLLAEGNKGIIAFETPSKHWTITDKITGFYLHQAKDKTLYLGTATEGLWYCKNPKIAYGKKLQWEKVGAKYGMLLNNILTISEDKFGNIWCAQKGIAVYNPKTKKAITWHNNDNPNYFGAMCSLKDTYETLWFGNFKGELVYYNGKNATDLAFKNFKKIKHPFFENGKKISFLKQWNDYLIVGANDKILLFNLKKWYANKTVSVRYLNAYETNFSAPTEQNTILTDSRDESIWFSTSDKVYQWEIKKWLTLPTFKVVPKIHLQIDTLKNVFLTKETINLQPFENNFKIEISYQTKDNLPRYINGALTKKGEKPLFDAPSLQHEFNFSNLASGNYVFYVRICQQDGSVNVFEYPIFIDSFLWQKWWFWTLFSLLFFGIIIYFFQKRNQIEKQKKKLSQLNLSSLSNQFRPHFMLNALNSIGSQMDDKPHAEKVISRLGESIDVLYNFTQKNKFTLPFDNEWKLVENSIEIQRLLFIPELNFIVNNIGVIPKDYGIPVGLLQIPIENALLHGLRNKTDDNCNLEIDFSSDNYHYFITIKDNGVGREKANKINKFKNNGNGLKTIFEMIQIINQHEKKAITFEIIDLKEPFGTMVKIALNKIIDYDKIKL